MEDAEKRRERLREMRAMASAAENFDDVGNSSVVDSLANPFVDSPGNVTDSNVPQRFGFYTDPMAAFSGNTKKRNEAPNQFNQGYSSVPSNASPMALRQTHFAGQMTSNATLTPAHQMQSSYSPNQRIHHPQGPYYNSTPYRSPMGGANRMPMHQGIPEPWNEPSTASSNYNLSPGRGMGHNFSHQWRPNNHGRGQAWQLGNNHGPGFGARPQQWHSGQGRWRGPGRGQGFQSRGSGSNESFDPVSYYDRSMMDDPWQQLQPVLWKPLDDSANNSSKSWLPPSISTKKPKLSEPSNKSSTKQSLAEYLSASFNEALDESPNV